MQYFKSLNAPLQKLATIKGVELWVKREDLIHEKVSGNKWRKLKYYVKDFLDSDKTVLLTFGGAFSNHLVATAALGNLANIPTKALVRGEEVQHNATLDYCREQGMEIEAITRKRYDLKDSAAFLALLESHLPEVYVVPEGGKGALGVKGCREILDEVEEEFDFIAVSAGTGTSAAGLLLHPKCKKLLCFSALKGGAFLRRAIYEQLAVYEARFSTGVNGEKLVNEGLILQENYHFGGYAKVNEVLIDFMHNYYEKYGLKLDPVYTAKLFYGLEDMIERGMFKTGDKILAIHTGGLQGIAGMNERLKKKGLKIDYEA